MAIDEVASVRTSLRSVLLQAMKQRDREAVEVYRMTLAAIDDAEAVPMDQTHRAGAVELSPVGVGVSEVDRRVLAKSDLRAIVRREAADLRRTAALIEDSAPAVARRLHRQADLVDAVILGGEVADRD